MLIRKGFTLAEALLTLMLIGVVAAIVMPFLYESIRNIRLTTSFKNIYAETHSALTNIALNEDCGNSLVCTKLLQGNQEESTTAFGDEFTKFGMSASRNCGTTTNNCFSHNVKISLSGNNTSSVQDTLKNICDFEGEPYTFVSTRGTNFAIYSFGLGCLTSDDAASAEYKEKYSLADANTTRNPMDNVCGIIVIDVNGESSPNQWGRDVYGLWITDNGKLDLVPFGNKHDKQVQLPDACSANNSLGCAAKIINDGWEMKY